MSRNKTNSTPTAFLTRAAIRQQHMKEIRDAAAKAKAKAIKEANQPMGLCLIIVVFMLVLFIAPPVAIVLL